MDNETLANIGRFQMHLLEAGHAFRRARKYCQPAEAVEFDQLEQRLREMLNRIFSAELDVTFDLMKARAVAIYRNQANDDSPNVSARIETNHEDRSWVEICKGGKLVATIEIHDGEPSDDVKLL